MKVLLVEDNIADILIVQEAFEELGKEFSLEFVNEGKLASEKIKTSFDTADSNYGLVLLDINIPSPNGRQILKYFKEDSRYSSLPIVILTTSTDFKDIEFAYSHKANAFISKPSDVDEFLMNTKQVVTYFKKLKRISIKK